MSDTTSLTSRPTATASDHPITTSKPSIKVRVNDDYVQYHGALRSADWHTLDIPLASRAEHSRILPWTLTRVYQRIEPISAGAGGDTTCTLRSDDDEEPELEKGDLISSYVTASHPSMFYKSLGPSLILTMGDRLSEESVLVHDKEGEHSMTVIPFNKEPSHELKVGPLLPIYGSPEYLARSRWYDFLRDGNREITKQRQGLGAGSYVADRLILTDLMSGEGKYRPDITTTSTFNTKAKINGGARALSTVGDASDAGEVQEEAVKVVTETLAFANLTWRLKWREGTAKEHARTAVYEAELENLRNQPRRQPPQSPQDTTTEMTPRQSAAVTIVVDTNASTCTAEPETAPEPAPIAIKVIPDEVFTALEALKADWSVYATQHSEVLSPLHKLHGQDCGLIYSDFINSRRSEEFTDILRVLEMSLCKASGREYDPELEKSATSYLRRRKTEKQREEAEQSFRNDIQNLSFKDWSEKAKESLELMRKGTAGNIETWYTRVAKDRSEACVQKKVQGVRDEQATVFGALDESIINTDIRLQDLDKLLSELPIATAEKGSEGAGDRVAATETDSELAVSRSG